MIEKHLNLLGTPMKDVVTGFEGMVDSVCFDAYGCVLATLAPKMHKEGKIRDSRWFDVKRLKPAGKRIMKAPSHFTTLPGQEPGPADKPSFSAPPNR